MVDMYALCGDMREMPNYMKAIQCTGAFACSAKLHSTSQPAEQSANAQAKKSTENTVLHLAHHDLGAYPSAPPTMKPARTEFIGKYSSHSKRNTSRLIRDQATVSPNMRKLKEHAKRSTHPPPAATGPTPEAHHQGEHPIRTLQLIHGNILSSLSPGGGRPPATNHVRANDKANCSCPSEPNHEIQDFHEFGSEGGKSTSRKDDLLHLLLHKKRRGTTSPRTRSRRNPFQTPPDMMPLRSPLSLLRTKKERSRRKEPLKSRNCPRRSPPENPDAGSNPAQPWHSRHPRQHLGNTGR